jgi:hypothetical protein
MNESKLIVIAALGAIMSVAVIIASIGQQPATAVTQGHNGANHHGLHGTNTNNGASGGVGGLGGDSGTGGNGGTNIGGCSSTC